MEYKKYCSGCKTEREINILDIYSQKKQRVVCGFCGTILLASRSEIDEMYWRYYGGCC